MVQMNFGNSENDFAFEEVERYKFSINIDNKESLTTSNDLEYLKSLYDNIVDEYINSDKHVIIAIFDYDKNTNIYEYDSEYDK